jgi:hypothetical protein
VSGAKACGYGPKAAVGACGTTLRIATGGSMDAAMCRGSGSAASETPVGSVAVAYGFERTRSATVGPASYVLVPAAPGGAQVETGTVAARAVDDALPTASVSCLAVAAGGGGVPRPDDAEAGGTVLSDDGARDTTGALATEPAPITETLRVTGARADPTGDATRETVRVNAPATGLSVDPADGATPDVGFVTAVPGGGSVEPAEPVTADAVVVTVPVTGVTVDVADDATSPSVLPAESAAAAASSTAFVVGGAGGVSVVPAALAALEAVDAASAAVPVAASTVFVTGGIGLCGAPVTSLGVEAAGVAALGGGGGVALALGVGKLALGVGAGAAVVAAAGAAGWSEGGDVGGVAGAAAAVLEVGAPGVVGALAIGAGAAGAAEVAGGAEVVDGSAAVAVCGTALALSASELGVKSACAGAAKQKPRKNTISRARIRGYSPVRMASNGRRAVRK